MKAALPVLFALLIASPAVAQDERVWTFAETEEGVHMSYGIPDSDDLGLAMVCQKGTGDVSVFFLVEHRIAAENPTAEGEWLDAAGRKAPWSVKAAVASGKGRTTLDAQANADEMNGGSSIEILVKADAAVLQRAATSGDIRVYAFGEAVEPPPMRPAQFKSFLRKCAG